VTRNVITLSLSHTILYHFR